MRDPRLPGPTALLVIALCAAAACSSTTADSPDGGGAGGTSFAGSWVARPYRWQVDCSTPDGSRQGGSHTETDNINRYRIEVSGSSLRMYVTDQDVGCVQLFSIRGNSATHTGDDGDCSFKVAGADGAGPRTTETDALTLAAGGDHFDEAAKYTVAYPGAYVCRGNDTATFFRE